MNHEEIQLKIGGQSNDMRMQRGALGSKITGMKKCRPLSRRFLLLGLASLSLIPKRSLASDVPRDLVERLNQLLISVMQQAEELEYAGRYSALAPVLSQIFNFPAMAKIAIGRRHWQSFDEAQRETLVEAFAKLSIATFAARFDGYSGERFEIGAVEQAPRNTSLIRNRLLRSDEEPVSINYLARKYDGTWRLMDVYLADKYSELAIKRSEFGAVMKNEGFDGLISAISKKIAELEAG